jgi:hypothetical protein
MPASEAVCPWACRKYFAGCPDISEYFRAFCVIEKADAAKRDSNLKIIILWDYCSKLP